MVDVLVSRTMLAAKDFGMKQVAVAGGVAANSALKKAMMEACKENRLDFYALLLFIVRIMPP